ncbi:MAG: 50S ribosomal protein L24e [Methanobacteriota archaeon]
MPVARKCSFCGERVEPGTGLMLVKRDGSVMFFCSSKCRRNSALGRKPVRMKWTQRYKQTGGKA